ncbi:hypothetical protein AQUCO_01300109v1 [Aquilegia coerulea]|uniref:Core Histone H2A/H2B/H3 domain-containing protein n=1 Tax=Aquilegia coerulea TaxID=218851 RepID=A0A2G5DZX4_AQUCA|nr:hypothetical protein AQUCO_01300109v1 [Aquilegia coerulea]
MSRTKQNRNKTRRRSTQAGKTSATRAPSTSNQRKPHRWRPGTVALREIRQYQKSSELLLPLAPFVRLVREVTNQFSFEVTRWTGEAMLAIQEVLEV